MFERFTDEARQVVVEAQREARDLRHTWIGPEHLLIAVLAEPDAPGAASLVRLGVTADSCRQAVSSLVREGDDDLDDDDATALRALGIDLDEVRRRAENTFGAGALDAATGSPGDPPRRLGAFRRKGRPGERPRGHIPFTKPAKKALELSLREAVARNERRIGCEHVTLALLRSDDTTSLFRRLGLEPQSTREQVLADLRQAA